MDAGINSGALERTEVRAPVVLASDRVPFYRWHSVVFLVSQQGFEAVDVFSDFV